MDRKTLFKHIRDFFILPFTVIAVVPHFIHSDGSSFIPDALWLKLVSAVFFIVGFWLLGYTIYLFGAFGKGTLAPWTPTQVLIVKGPYKYCRNPMISGVFFVLVGETLLFHSTNLLIWTVSFFVINTIYFILKEEPDLHKRFGESYQEYRENVPRWIPRVRPYQQ